MRYRVLGTELIGYRLACPTNTPDRKCTKKDRIFRPLLLCPARKDQHQTSPKVLLITTDLFPPPPREPHGLVACCRAPVVVLLPEVQCALFAATALYSMPFRGGAQLQPLTPAPPPPPNTSKCPKLFEGLDRIWSQFGTEGAGKRFCHMVQGNFSVLAPCVCVLKMLRILRVLICLT